LLKHYKIFMSDEQKKEEKDEGDKKPAAEEKTAEQLSEDYLSNWKRALADYDNLKRETTKEKAEMAQFAQAMSAMNFIGVYDNYKKALAHRPNTADSKAVEQWLVGVECIKKQFVETLKQLGIEEIKTVGEKFDPALHEAVGEETLEGGGESEIVKEIEGGYKMGEKVIKAAKVIVSK